LEDKKATLIKERYSIESRDDVLTWRQNLSDLDQQYKSDLLTLNSENWISTRKLLPRVVPLGRDALGNTVWLFTSRDRKERDFGGWIILQTNGHTGPSGEPIAPTSPSQDSHSDLTSLYYLESLADVDTYSNWIEELLSKDRTSPLRGLGRRSSLSSRCGSPNSRGQQTFVAEVESTRKKLLDFSELMADTKSLRRELNSARDWMILKYTYPTNTVFDK
jgi:hypothetical protein